MAAEGAPQPEDVEAAGSTARTVGADGKLEVDGCAVLLDCAASAPAAAARAAAEHISSASASPPEHVIVL